MDKKIRDNFFEFVRYAIVGGIAALVDMATNYAMLFISSALQKTTGGR